MEKNADGGSVAPHLRMCFVGCSNPAPCLRSLSKFFGVIHLGRIEDDGEKHRFYHYFIDAPSRFSYKALRDEFVRFAALDAIEGAEGAANKGIVMNLPQFTAERSLLKSTRHYRATDSSEGTQGMGELELVIPAIDICNPAKFYRCALENPQDPAACQNNVSGVCTRGWDCCEGECTDTSSDPANCGGCGVEYDCSELGYATGAAYVCCGGNCCSAANNVCCGDVCCEPANCCGDVCCAPGSGEKGPPVCHTFLYWEPGGILIPEPVCLKDCDEHLTQCGVDCVNLNNDVENCGRCGHKCPFPNIQTCQNGSCVCPTVPAPANLADTYNGFAYGVMKGLTSDNNYIITNACNNILGLTVTLQISPEQGSELVSDNGFSVQLNGFSPSGISAAQQYTFSISGSTVQASIDNWQSNLATEIVNGSPPNPICSTPINNGIPAGWSLVLQLLYDQFENVKGGTYSVLDNNQQPVGNSPVQFLVQNAGCGNGGPCSGFQPGAPGQPSPTLSPITAFTVDVVGLANGAGTNFSSGAGTITYSVSSGQLSANSNLPSCIETPGATVEHSNAAYGTMIACPAKSLTQSFQVTPMTCNTTNGPCTGAGGSKQCLTVNGATQCCNSPHQLPWITGCSNGTIEVAGCGSC
jgi:hypothetical protein